MTKDADWSGFVYGIFFLQGMGMLYPWNVFISASGYYGDRFCTTRFWEDFENYFGVAFNVSNVLLLYYSVRSLGHVMLEKRVVWPLAINAVVFGTTTLLVLVGVNADFMFGLTMVLVVTAGMAVAVLQGGLFGLAGSMPPTYTQAMMAGQGMGGTLVAASGLITTAADSHNTCSDDDDAGDDHLSSCEEYAVDWSSFVYFLIATLVLLSCIVTYYMLVRHPLVVRYRSQGHEDGLETPLLDDADAEEASINNNGSKERSDSSMGVMAPGVPSDAGIDEQEDMPAAEIFSHIKVHAINAFFTFFVTLSLFPSVTAKIESVNACPVNDNMWYNDLFIPWSFVMFNLFDWIGRSSAGHPKMQLSDRTYTAMSYARLVFFPLFLFCNVNDSRLGVLFKSDTMANAIMLAFAFTNGWLGSLAMMRGPGTVERVDDQRAAGTMMVFSLCSGLACGSFFSFACEALLTGEEPF